MNAAKQRLAFALDVPNKQEALRFVRLLEGSVGCFKVGLELFVREGPDVLRVIQNNSQVDIFLDLKLHDIPATVRGALDSAAVLGVRYITVHAAEGPQALEAVQEVQKKGLEVLAVSVLTSVSDGQLPALGYDGGWTVSRLVLARAEAAHRAGCAGIVCSGTEAAAVKKKYGDALKVVVPGIRPGGGSIQKDDQSRTVTPAQAIRDGADLLVVGRPIRDAADPKQAAEDILQEIAAAFQEKA